MPANNLRELAKQGDPKVIAQIINHTLQKKGIKVDIVRSNSSLEVTLQSEQVANQKKALVEFIRTGMDKLGVESINTVRVYGVPTGQRAPVWEEEIILKPEAFAQPIPEDDPLYATEEAQISLETEKDYQTDPPDDFSEDEDKLFDEEQEANSDGDLEEDLEGDFEEGEYQEEDSEEDFEEGEYEEEDSEGDFEEGEYEEATPAKKKLPILAIVLPLVILVPLLALGLLHFTGIFRLPFLGGSQADSSTPNTVESPAGSPANDPPAQGSPAPSPEAPSGDEIWKNATTTAYGAAVKAGEAQTRAEWNEVASEWQKAIDLMKDVPESNSNYQKAQQKAQEYQNNLNVAKQRAAQAPN